MPESNLSASQLLQSLLEPLLEDFEYWFARSQQLLENEKISFMTEQEQSDLLDRVKQAQLEVNTSRMLFNATGKQVGLDMATLAPWHQLLGECWRVGMRYRQIK
ncbi:hypothetical protein CEP10_07800 [Cylindrospermopsis raciborskii S07]|uniref:DUF2605 domain-containing protein n=2 Tax=Cylindrospermopsis raciborskii TaxID=77022 RepID=A0A853M8N4_9CYAN|nr:DUF2605 domain-containing protein [Cylindrospermopsis raciborskii]EFA71168.1 conserved hypothetical protein [Cylindrospermopsis raciborskii CS-505]MBA4455134.1 DUF2605 domain-containing protein [Cylindrospermopsis raciborskii CS-506_B]OBU75760.1 hypothetical protein A9P98_05095 [Cylindrospermopsis raciborskii CS-505]PNJ97059.1 hypothetical protein CEP14_06955 [Cylindrospermopsis raciborskii C04]PNJ97952.1 hypothetical protein CEP13_02395 [Cylindrospermopsis raciborskii C03]